MLLSQAIDTLHSFSPDNLSALSELLDPKLVEECLKDTGTVTFRKRRLPMELMVWSVVGMALFRNSPMSQVANQLDIVLPGKRPFVVPSAVVQARQRLGVEPVKAVFEKTQSLWRDKTPLPHWNGLTLLGVDGVVWRTPDTPDNSEAFARTGTKSTTSDYPQLRMVCQMELTSHLVVSSAFDCISNNEVTLTAELIDKTADHSLTIFDKGFYALGLLMATAPQSQVNLQDTPYYHCVTRCVRRSFLCGEDPVIGKSYEHRRAWVESRLLLLSDVFAVI
ncbi:IS4 family transposase [Ferrimonas gelatinilytica]|uniref:Mobile element protein n=1 Tax=Ferrimonas gelatinilytica TaxID=1255257 RepID=A0ABP9RTB9_9GAMM